MSNEFVKIDRLIPEIPKKGRRIRLVFDSDVANEIDDLYAISLAIAAPERFDIKGICCAHFNNSSPGAGPNSISTSMELARKLLDVAGMTGKIPILAGSHPMMYIGYPSESEGVDFIIEQARLATSDDPLWIVVLGASSTTASVVLKIPELLDRVRVVFHSRCDYMWPERSMQFNVKGDIHAARTLLSNSVPLVWFDTGTHLRIPYQLSASILSGINPLGKFLHDFRNTQFKYTLDMKGFFDMGDIVLLLKPELCTMEVVKAPAMDEYMYFNFFNGLGKMLRVYDIENDGSWNLLFSKLHEMQI